MSQSVKVCVRLKPEELAMLDRVAGGEVKRNRSEQLRLLLHREYRRRTTGSSVVADREVSSEHRTGRPADPERKCQTFLEAFHGGDDDEVV